MQSIGTLTSSITPGLVAWTLVLVPAAPAQQPADTFSGSTTTLIVEVPVEVTLEGEPLRGLTAENFTLSDGGRRQRILSVEEIDLQRVEPGKSPVDVLPVAARRHFLLLFDRSHARPAALERARLAVTRLVTEDLHPADLVGIASYSRSRGAEWQLGFTPDRQQVARALESLVAEQSKLLSADPLRLSIRTIDADDGEIDSAGGSARSIGLLAAADTARDLRAMQDKARQAEQIAEVGVLARSLGRLADAMRRVDGRKHVIFFSEGFDEQLLLGTTDQERRDEMNRNAQDNALWLVNSEDYFGSSSAFNVVDEMNQQFRRADATVHPVDIGGLRAGGGIESQGSVHSGSGRGGLFMIASGTGGEMYENFNDLGSAMGKLLEKTSVTYLLTFQPSDATFDGAYRKLKVKLDNVPRKARLTHRPGYFAPTADVPGGLEAQLDLAQRLFDGRPGPVTTGLLATPLRPADSRSDIAAYVAVLVEVDGKSFLAGDPQAKKVKAELYLYAFRPSGELADVFAQTTELDADGSAGALGQRGFKFYAPLLLDAGAYTLRALVRNGDTGLTGLQVRELRIEPKTSQATLLLPPYFPEPVDSWPLVRGRRAQLGRDAEPAYPFAHGATTYVPAARPELTANQVVPVFLAGYDLGEPNEVLSELIDAAGESVANPRWRLDPVGLDGPNGLRRHIAAFEMPDVEAGDYTLTVELVNADGRRSTVGETALRLVTASPASQLLALRTQVDFGPPAGDLRASTAAGSQVDATGELAAAEDEMAKEELIALYRRAAEGLEMARRGSLLVELAAAEAMAIQGKEERGVRRLARLQRGVVSELASADAEALVPLIVLHHDLFLEHRAARRPWLEQHSLEMSRELAQLYAERGGSTGSSIVAARALASLGGYLQSSGRSAGRAFFQDAISLDAANEAARLGLAADYEKRGGPYTKAVTQLQQLLDLRPDSREGRLRLAINLLRVTEGTGAVDVAAKKAAAEAHLRQLAEGAEADWIYSLAVQELGRLLASTRRLGEAEEILAVAVERRPEDQKLPLQLAFLLDRSRRPDASRRLLEALSGAASEPRAAGAAPPARGLYNQWPHLALDQARAALRAGSELRSSRLYGEQGGATTGGDR